LLPAQISIDGSSASPFRRDAADAGSCGAASRPVIAALNFHFADDKCPEEVPEIFARLFGAPKGY
jgi:hypothetical protein